MTKIQISLSLCAKAHGAAIGNRIKVEDADRGLLPRKETTQNKHLNPFLLLVHHDTLDTNPLPRLIRVRLHRLGRSCIDLRDYQYQDNITPQAESEQA